MLGISQHGITLINDLKPLDVVVSDKDTLILIDHPMLKSINSLIIYSRIQDQHIDSINILLQKKNEEITDCMLLCVSQKGTIKLQEERYKEIQKLQDKQKVKIKVLTWVAVAELIVIVISLIK
jgi:hypothetical protein